MFGILLIPTPAGTVIHNDDTGEGLTVKDGEMVCNGLVGFITPGDIERLIAGFNRDGRPRETMH